MEKAIRANLRMVRAAALKRPGYELDPTGGEKHTYKCVYVTSQGKQVTQRCTYEVWKRCEGKNLNGRPRDGLSDKLHAQFLMWVDAEQCKEVPSNTEPGLLTSIDVLPETYYRRKQVMPADMIDRTTLELKIDQATGSVEVVKLAPDVTSQMLERIIYELNKLATIEPGDHLPGGYDVVAVNGKTIEIDCVAPSAATGKPVGSI